LIIETVLSTLVIVDATMSKISNIAFQSKESSNQEQENAFLSLAPVEKFYRFVELMMLSKNLPQKNPIAPTNDNFEIVIKSKN
jgi:hypothetical protein